MSRRRDHRLALWTMTAEDAPTAARITAAQVVLDAHGTDSLAPFALAPAKSLALVAGGLLAYRIVGGTVVVAADPIGPAGTAAAALAQLRARAHRAGLAVVLYGCSARHLADYRALGLRAMCVGEEAVVDPTQFTLEGRAVRKLRQSVHRVERRGWCLSALRGREIDTELEAEIDGLQQAWRDGHHQVLGFAMSLGDFDPGVRSDDLYLLARSPEGRLGALIRFLDHGGNLSLDTMRRVGETPNGLNEALIALALSHARAAGVAEVSLNYAGFAHLIRRAPDGGPVRRLVTHLFLRLLSGRFQMDRLVLFNEKFSPDWRPRYLVYESRRALPGAALRVLQAEGYLPEPRPHGRRGHAAGADPAPSPAAADAGR